MRQFEPADTRTDGVTLYTKQNNPFEGPGGGCPGWVTVFRNYSCLGIFAFSHAAANKWAIALDCGTARWLHVISPLCEVCRSWFQVGIMQFAYD